MHREAHKLCKFGPGAWPDLFVFVQATAAQVFNGEADDTGHLKMVEWSARAHTCFKGFLVGRGDAYGQTDKALWYLLAALSRQYGQRIWIMSMSAREVMTLTGLWDKLLDGSATVDGADPYERPETSPPKAPTPGYVVLESPPTIAAFKLRSELARFVWVDVANYGASNREVIEADQEAHASVAGGMVDEPWLCPGGATHQTRAVHQWFSAYANALISLDLGAPEHTAASTAQAGFRRSYMDVDIITHDNERVLTMERKALYGGRCEARIIGTVSANQLFSTGGVGIDGKKQFVAGAGGIWHLDVNSLYPSVAQDASLPVRLMCVTRQPKLDVLLGACRALAVVGEVRVKTDVPCVPVRRPEGTIYPTGDFWTVLCGPEILLAAECGRVVDSRFVACYESRIIYRRWVSDLYARRREMHRQRKHGIASAIKSILNASFGKWAQRKRRWIDKPDEVCPYPWYQWYEWDAAAEEMVQWRSFAWRVQCLHDDGEPADSFPAITAYIQSLGRVRLWSLIQCADPANVLYYDTDSLWVTKEGFDRLTACGWLDETALGKLKVVGNYGTVEFHGQKRYVADGFATAAGIDGVRIEPGDLAALQPGALPLRCYLAHREPPGLDRRLAVVRLNVPYKVGQVTELGIVEPWRLDSDDLP